MNCIFTKIWLLKINVETFICKIILLDCLRNKPTLASPSIIKIKKKKMLQTTYLLTDQIKFEYIQILA